MKPAFSLFFPVFPCFQSDFSLFRNFDFPFLDTANGE